MFYDETITMKQVESDPSLIFELIKEGHADFVGKILSKKLVSVNEVDEKGDTVLMKLLRVGAYDIVLKHMKNKDFDVNHQNEDGDTFAHILVTINYTSVVDLMKQLKRNKSFIPNIKNNAGETILDKSINERYIYTTVKVLEDQRFDNIDVVSFKNLYDTYIKSKKYGKYARLTNLDMILENLENKNLLPRMEVLIAAIKDNYEKIKNALISDNLKVMDEIIHTCLRANI